MDRAIITRAWCKEIGAQLARARTQRGLSQRDLSAICGLTQPDIAAIESGARNPTIGTLGIILSALGMTLEINSPSLPARAE